MSPATSVARAWIGTIVFLGEIVLIWHAVTGVRLDNAFPDQTHVPDVPNRRLRLDAH